MDKADKVVVPAGREFTVTVTSSELTLLLEMLPKKKFSIEEGNALENAQFLLEKLKDLVQPRLV